MIFFGVTFCISTQVLEQYIKTEHNHIHLISKSSSHSTSRTLFNALRVLSSDFCASLYNNSCSCKRFIHKQRHLFRNQTKGIHTVSYSKTTRAWHASDCWWPMAVSGERDCPLKQATIMYFFSVPKFIICNEVHVQPSICNWGNVLPYIRQSVSSNNKNESWKEPVRLCNQLLSAGDPPPSLVSVYCQAGQWCSKALRFKSS